MEITSSRFFKLLSKIVLCKRGKGSVSDQMISLPKATTVLMKSVMPVYQYESYETLCIDGMIQKIKDEDINYLYFDRLEAHMKRYLEKKESDARVVLDEYYLDNLFPHIRQKVKIPEAFKVTSVKDFIKPTQAPCVKTQIWPELRAELKTISWEQRMEAQALMQRYNFYEVQKENENEKQKE